MPIPLKDPNNLISALGVQAKQYLSTEQFNVLLNQHIDVTTDELEDHPRIDWKPIVTVIAPTMVQRLESVVNVADDPNLYPRNWTKLPLEKLMEQRGRYFAGKELTPIAVFIRMLGEPDRIIPPDDLNPSTDTYINLDQPKPGEPNEILIISGNTADGRMNYAYTRPIRETDNTLRIDQTYPIYYKPSPQPMMHSLAAAFWNGWTEAVSKEMHSSHRGKRS
jgi:hypothetical protein